jgi:transcriptional regulator with GAF, ATPase, and Fis domain
MRQRLELQEVFDDGRIARRVVMEQSVRTYEVHDVPDAIRCLLRKLRGRGNILEMVSRMLVQEALRESGGVQKDAAEALGISRRAICYRNGLLDEPLGGRYLRKQRGGGGGT